jgi:uncharacterized membrane protein YkvI
MQQSRGGVRLEEASFFRRYLLPGLVYQSVVIAGGYGTGRELVEFFMTRGAAGGLLGMGATMLIWSAVAMVSFELARVFRAFDYRSFFKALLCRGWIAFEICYVVLLMIILAVIAAASGTILEETFGLPYAMGVLGIMIAVGGLVLGGSKVVERYMAGWAFVLYSIYLVFVVWCFSRFGERVTSTLAGSTIQSGWLLGGIEYASYCLAAIPTVLFTLRYHHGRRETLGAGLLTGPLAIAPAVLFYLAMVSQYPNILDKPVPVNYLLQVLGSTSLQVVFQVALLGTLIATGTGLIHAVNERIDQVFQERGSRMPKSVRSACALGLLLVGTLLSTFGLIDLIAKGYGTLTWFFLAIYVIPVLTMGIWKIRNRPTEKTSPTG